MTSPVIFLALQPCSLVLHTFNSSRRSCLITCSSFSLLRNAAPHLLPLNEAISNRVGDLIKPRGGSYSFQSTPCCSTGRPLIIDAKAGSVRLGSTVRAFMVEAPRLISTSKVGTLACLSASGRNPSTMITTTLSAKTGAVAACGARRPPSPAPMRTSGYHHLAGPPTGLPSSPGGGQN